MSSKDKPGQTNKISSPPLIIVADDDPSVRLMLHHILEKEHFRVIEAETGQEAVNLSIKHNPDIVLLDAVMPELNGFVSCKLIKDHHPETPIIMITSLDDDLSVEQAFLAGADDYITKPINWSVLKHRINHTLAINELQIQNRAESELEETIRHHNYNLLFKPRIDLDTKSINCAESHFYKNLHHEFPLFEQLNSHAAVSIDAIDNLLKYAFTKFSILKQSHPDISILSLPLFPFIGKPELYIEQLNRSSEDSGIDLNQLEISVEQCSLADLRILNLLKSIAELPLSLSINKFTFSLHTLEYLKNNRCDSIQLYLPMIKSAFDEQPDPALLKQMLEPYKSFDLKFMAEQVDDSNQLELIKTLGCIEASGSFVGDQIEY